MAAELAILKCGFVLTPCISRGANTIEPDMKHRLALLLAALTVTAAPLLAQEGLDIDVNIGQESAVWYANPWIWVGVAAFVLLLVLATRRPAKAA